MKIALVCLALGGLLVGCSTASEAPEGAPSSPDGGTVTPPDDAVRPSPPSTAPTGTTAAAPLPDGFALRAPVVADGFQNPVQIVPHPVSGATLVVEQVGRIRQLTGETVLDLTDRVTSGGERGLLGVAFHPIESRVFIHYSGTEGGQTVLSEFPVTEDGIADEEQVLYEQTQPASNHNGGAVVFDPDGNLVLALGDGGGAGDQFGNGQATGTHLATLLRFDVSTPGEVAPAEDNPFLDGGGAPEVWVYGVRNPWRIAIHGDLLYVADVGQDAVEEVTVLPLAEAAGANLGWPILEGSRCYERPDCSAEGTVPPDVELLHEDGVASVIGGRVYRGAAIPELVGHYVFSDLADGLLRTLLADEAGQVRDRRDLEATVPSPLGFGVDAAGELYVGSADGAVRRLEPA